jgi:tetratricopeptide (TPR) repeat protein
MLARAGQRAESLAAAAEARRYYEQAAELTEERSTKAALIAKAGEMAARAADPDGASRLLEESINLYEAEGDTHSAARVSTRLARIERFTGRLDDALARLERAFDVISGDEPDEDLALLAARLANAYWTVGDLDRAEERAELALDVAETQGYTEAIVIALGARAAVAHSRGHRQEGLALLKHELSLALEHGLTEEASGSYFILSDASFHLDRYEDALAYQDEALMLIRKVGNRPYEWSILAERTYALFMTGRWDEALGLLDDLTEEQARSGGMFLSLLSGPLDIHVHRGDLAEAKKLYSLFSNLEGSSDVQERACFFGATAVLRGAEKRHRDALAVGREVLAGVQTLAISHQAVEQGLVAALEAAAALDDRAAAEEILKEIASIPPGRRPAFLDAHTQRFRGRLDSDPAALETAAARFREIGIPFWRAVALLEHGELTGDEESLAESREILDQLKAAPWLERLDGVTETRPGVLA